MSPKPKKTKEELKQDIIGALNVEAPDGLSRADIIKELGDAADGALRELVAQGLVRAQGATKARRFYLASATKTPKPKPQRAKTQPQTPPPSPVAVERVSINLDVDDANLRKRYIHASERVSTARAGLETAQRERDAVLAEILTIEARRLSARSERLEA